MNVLVSATCLVLEWCQLTLEITPPHSCHHYKYCLSPQPGYFLLITTHVSHSFLFNTCQHSTSLFIGNFLKYLLTSTISVFCKLVRFCQVVLIIILIIILAMVIMIIIRSLKDRRSRSRRLILTISKLIVSCIDTQQGEYLWVSHYCGNTAAQDQCHYMIRGGSREVACPRSI